VMLVMADGSVDGDDEQEVHASQLILCEILTMFNTLKKSGNFVCKIYDCLTPFTIGIVYILYRHFESVCIIKPWTSNPQSSERYVVCKNLLQKKPPVTDYLFSINGKTSENESIPKVVEESVISNDKAFCSYLRDSNTTFADSQIQALKRIHTYIENPQLSPVEQSDLKARCCELLKIPLYQHFNPVNSSILLPPPKAKPPSSYHYEEIATKSKEQQSEEARNRHKNSVYSSQWGRPSSSSADDSTSQKQKSDISGEELLSSYLQHPSIRKPSSKPQDKALSEYRKRLRHEMGMKEEQKEEEKDKGEEKVEPKTRKKARVKAATTVVAPTQDEERRMAAKHNPGKLKSTQNANLPQFELTPDKMKALEKYKVKK